jgi:hypothetical protein
MGEGQQPTAAEPLREATAKCAEGIGNRQSATALGFDGEKYRQASTHQKEWGMDGPRAHP